MSDWRGTCRQCGKAPMKGRAWCRECVKRLKHSGVTDSVELLTHDEARAAGAPGPDIFLMSGKGTRQT